MKIQVSFHSPTDEQIYNDLKKHFRDTPFMPFGRNLSNFFRGNPALMVTDLRMLDIATFRPDLILILLSPQYLLDNWLSAESVALAKYGEIRGDNLVCLYLTNNLQASEIPSHLRTCPVLAPGSASTQDLIGALKSVRRLKRVFIGHGRSKDWQDLSSILSNFDLKPDHFEAASTAGMYTLERVQHMLIAADFAFLIMTAEDAHADGNLHARENVTYELGMFHGYLGFRRAIILREHPCHEFTNIKGLQHIEFHTGNMSDVSDAIREVLQREGVLNR